MSDVIQWLRSPEGESWSKSVHVPSVNILVSLKEDTYEDEALEYKQFIWYT